MIEHILILDTTKFNVTVFYIICSDILNKYFIINLTNLYIGQIIYFNSAQIQRNRLFSNQNLLSMTNPHSLQMVSSEVNLLKV